MRENNDTLTIYNHLGSILGDISEEISLLHQLSNTIRKASKETHNLKAATAFVIRDEDGNDCGSAFRDLFALRIIHWRFPECDEVIKERLAAAMLLRRKRILYKRSRYGILPSTNALSTLRNNVVNTGGTRESSQGTRQKDTDESFIVSPQPERVEEQDDAKSRAITATTLHMERWKQASAPSMISRANTILLNDHERLDFPPPPKGPILQKLKARKERWVAECEAQLASLPGYLLYKQHDGNPPLEPDKISWLQSQISNLRDDLEEQIESDRDACHKGNMEVICPYCCSALSSAIVMNDLKWM